MRGVLLGAAVAASVVSTPLPAGAQTARPTQRPPETRSVDLPALRDALEDLRRRGPAGDRKLIVTYETTRRGVRLSPGVKRRYPRHITIVLQYQFANLVLSADGFAVDLWFSGKREKVFVPYAAITQFSDRQVEFEADV